MNKSILTLLFLLIPIYCCYGQNHATFNVLFWNTENLFDCKHDSLKNDTDFLPTSLKRWNSYKYWQKLKALSKGIIATGQWNPPSLVGLCEVENDSVLFDLTQRTPLRNLGYKYLITNSKDFRGIDVALLYQPEFFRLITHRAISVGLLPVGHRPSRDLLHVTGKVWSGDTLDIFVVHLPSRYGGQKHSEPNRIHVAQILKNHVDTLWHTRTNPLVLIMGDFNDYPSNNSIYTTLGAKEPSLPYQAQQLYNLVARKRKKNWGTYKFKAHWGVLDQFIVSGNLLDSLSNCYTSEETTQIITYPFLLIEDKKFGGYKPFRTYNGMKYQGGYSDHLPVLSSFTITY